MNELKNVIKAIEKALDQGRLFQANNMASDLLLKYPDEVRLTQLKVIALNRLGQPEKAIDAIQGLVKLGYRDGETLGLLGRVYKDLYQSTGDRVFLEKAAEAYYEGYMHSHEYYPGINAASLFRLLDKKEKATFLANEIIRIIGKPIDYWSTVTLGEAWLINGDIAQSEIYYQKAIDGNQKQFGKFRSTYNQLLFLQEGMDIPEQLTSIFPKPNLAVFSGHMIDAPDRAEPRFPADIENEVRIELAKTVNDLDIDIGFTSMASGGDILFMEILRERNAEINAYMPFRKEDFEAASLQPAGGDWITRFEKHHTLNPKYLTLEPYLDMPALFNHLGNVMMGECMLLAEQYDVVPYFISVLASNQVSKTGGTKQLTESWPYQETHYNIDPTKFLPSTAATATKHTGAPSTSSNVDKHTINRIIGNILFADIVGFTKLIAEDTPVKILALLERMKSIIAPFKEGMHVINSWGDAIILCHKDIDAIMTMAQGIQAVFNGPKTDSYDLPEGTNIRIALHKGPVFLAEDPITAKSNVYGSSINRTARMEPVTLPGSIYASDQFAASLKLETGDKYEYHHVGIIELPKGFGKQEVYKISRKTV